MPFYRVFLFTIHKISLKKKHPQKTKWASIPHEAYFIAKRTKFRCSTKSIYSKAQLARTITK